MPFDATPIPAVTRSLMEARQRLVEHGWCGYGARSRDGVCAIVAISDASEDDDLFLAAYHLLLAAVRETGFRGGDVIDYNDSHSKAEVLAVFDCAIELSWTA
jgi:hypothetical protein